MPFAYYELTTIAQLFLPVSIGRVCTSLNLRDSAKSNAEVTKKTEPNTKGFEESVREASIGLKRPFDTTNERYRAFHTLFTP